MPHRVPTAIGVSVGTQNWAGCVKTNGHPRLFKEAGQKVIPAYVAFTPTSILVGMAALNQWGTNPTNTIYDVKRILGRFYDDPVTQDYIKEWPFKVVDEDNKPKYEVLYKGCTVRFSPEEIAALLFKKIKELAQEYIHKVVTEVVITVPAQFNFTQRQATLDAASIAGLTVMQLANEPLATAITHSMDPDLPRADGGLKMVVITSGSGFMDISLIAEEEEGHRCRHACRVSRGTTTGVDVTRQMVKYVADQFLEQHGVDIYQNPRAYVRLWKECERAKLDMVHQRNSIVHIRSLINKIDLVAIFPREVIDDMLQPLREQVVRLLDEALEHAQWSLGEVNRLLLAGGIRHFPSIQDELYKIGQKTQSMTIVECPEYHSVPGAATLASFKQQHGYHPVTAADDPEGTPIGSRGSFRGGSASGPRECPHDPRSGPQGGPRGDPQTGDLPPRPPRSLCLKDLFCETFEILEVASQTISIMTPEGKCCPLVHRDACIPVTRTDGYTTKVDNQTRIDIEIYEGDKLTAAQNRLIGTVSVTSFPPRKKGVPILMVTFKIDDNGVLTASARDRTPDDLGDGTAVTEVEMGILSREEVRQLVKEFPIRFPPAPVPEPRLPDDVADQEIPPRTPSNEDDASEAGAQSEARDATEAGVLVSEAVDPVLELGVPQFNGVAGTVEDIEGLVNSMAANGLDLVEDDNVGVVEDNGAVLNGVSENGVEDVTEASNLLDQGDGEAGHGPVPEVATDQTPKMNGQQEEAYP